jgi:2',3'-cyclic-nucleotide 2'-phosphodiesterase/3'-nucleotidase
MDRTTPKIARLRILATSDVHMHLLPYDYLSDTPTPGEGLQALGATIEGLRRAADAQDPQRHVVLVDNGDMLQGNALGDHLASDLRRNGRHPVAQVMNAFGYDAMGLGNHDFDYGLDYLGWFSRSLDAPVLSSNTQLCPAQDWLSDRCLLSVGQIKLGILSVLPPRSVEALHAQIGNSARFYEMIAVVERTAQRLRSSGADLVLALAHTGLDPGNPEQALAEIARTGRVDAMIGGHQHAVFPSPIPPGVKGDARSGTLFDVPTAMPGCNGTLVACIDLDLERDGDKPWTVTGRVARVVAAGDRADAQSSAVFDPIRSAHEAACTRLDQVITSTPVPLHSYFAQVRPTTIHALIAEAQRIAIDDHRQGSPLADLPLLSAVSLPRAGGKGGAENYTDIPAGPLTARHLAQLSVYANQIWAVALSGAELAEWLEKSASGFAQVNGSDGCGLIDTAFPAFDFDVIYGLTYEIDPSRPARYDRIGRRRNPDSRRIGALSRDGKAIHPKDLFLVAVNSFRACGGGQFPGLHPDRPVLRPSRSVTDAVEAYLISSQTPPETEPWRFSGCCSGIVTWFDTGEGATAHLDDIAHLSPGIPKPQPTGFLRIPITL